MAIQNLQRLCSSFPEFFAGAARDRVRTGASLELKFSRTLTSVSNCPIPWLGLVWLGSHEFRLRNAFIEPGDHNRAEPRRTGTPKRKRTTNHSLTLSIAHKQNYCFETFALLSMEKVISALVLCFYPLSLQSTIFLSAERG